MTKVFREFEELGKEVLMHKYFYYVLNMPTISDQQYDELEIKYTKLAKTLPKEPPVHLIADWSELSWMSNGTVVGFPNEHPWTAEVRQYDAMRRARNRIK